MAAEDAAERRSLAAFRETVARTLAAESARLIHRQDFIVSFDGGEKSRAALEQQSLVWRAVFAVGTLTFRAGKLLWKLRFGDRDFRHLEAEGYVEPARRRYQMDFGSYAETYIDGDLYGGRSGRPLSTLDPWPRTSKQPVPLWALGVLMGASDVTPTGASRELRGSVCAELSVTADLERAAGLTDFTLHVPAVASFEELSRLSFSVWSDGEHVRLVRFTRPDEFVLTFEFWDYGVDVGRLDWTCLPVFKD